MCKRETVLATVVIPQEQRETLNIREIIENYWETGLLTQATSQLLPWRAERQLVRRGQGGSMPRNAEEDQGIKRRRKIEEMEEYLCQLGEEAARYYDPSSFLQPYASTLRRLGKTVDDLLEETRGGPGLTDDYLRPEPVCAVRFREEDYDDGAYVLYTRTQGVALPERVFLIKKRDLELLRKAGIPYESYISDTGDPAEILEHFNVDPGALNPPPEPSLYELVRDYLILRVANLRRKRRA